MLIRQCDFCDKMTPVSTRSKFEKDGFCAPPTTGGDAKKPAMTAKISFIFGNGAALDVCEECGAKAVAGAQEIIRGLLREAKKSDLGPSDAATA